MIFVAKGNEMYNTTEIQQKVAAVAAKMQQIQLLRNEIQEMCQDDDLYHLDMAFYFDIDCDPIDRHNRWLASSHNC